MKIKFFLCMLAISIVFFKSNIVGASSSQSYSEILTEIDPIEIKHERKMNEYFFSYLDEQQDLDFNEYLVQEVKRMPFQNMLGALSFDNQEKARYLMNRFITKMAIFDDENIVKIVKLARSLVHFVVYDSREYPYNNILFHAMTQFNFTFNQYIELAEMINKMQFIEDLVADDPQLFKVDHCHNNA